MDFCSVVQDWLYLIRNKERNESTFSDSLKNQRETVKKY
jgi:hypothetical protein